MKATMPKKYYVGYDKTTRKPEIFRASTTPTFATHGETYSYAVGSFWTKRGAWFMCKYGQNNPHCRTVGEAEKLGKLYAHEYAQETTQ